MAVLDEILEGEKITLKNRRRIVKEDSTYVLNGSSGQIKFEFVHTTHSTLQCVFIAMHTKEGTFFYALDFKLDNYPVIGEPPKYNKLRELGRKGIKVLVLDALYSGTERKTPSERIARNMVEDAMASVRDRNAAMIVTTFSSHIARLKTITELGRKLNREVVFLGRSLNKYMTAAKIVGKAPFSNQVKMVTYRRQLEKTLKRINQNKSKYLVVCTGHQGEPNSILDRIARNQLPFNFEKEDQLIFSSKTIPTPQTQLTREQLQKRLKKKQLRIFDQVHVSGHGGKEDIRELIKLTNPEHVIPSHGDFSKTKPAAELAEEMGYKLNKTVHLMKNTDVLEI